MAARRQKLPEEDTMIRVIYRWQVQAGQEDAFARAWSRGTRTIRATCKGAHGSVLLRSQRAPAEFLGIAQ
jgi:heme-degrading monooxygenase HmoA